MNSLPTAYCVLPTATGTPSRTRTYAFGSGGQRSSTELWGLEASPVGLEPTTFGSATQRSSTELRGHLHKQDGVSQCGSRRRRELSLSGSYATRPPSAGVRWKWGRSDAPRQTTKAAKLVTLLRVWR